MFDFRAGSRIADVVVASVEIQTDTYARYAVAGSDSRRGLVEVVAETVQVDGATVLAESSGAVALFRESQGERSLERGDWRERVEDAPWRELLDIAAKMHAASRQLSSVHPSGVRVGDTGETLAIVALDTPGFVPDRRTLLFVAPEVELGGEGDARADVYALAAVVAWGLGAEWTAEPGTRDWRRRRKGLDQTPLVEFDLTLPPELADVLERALSNERDARPSNAGILRTLLDTAVRRHSRLVSAAEAYAEEDEVEVFVPQSTPQPEGPSSFWATDLGRVAIVAIILSVAGVAAGIQQLLRPVTVDDPLLGEAAQYATPPACSTDAECGNGYCDRDTCAPEGFVYMPAAGFEMGKPEGDSAWPLAQIRLSRGYFFATAEVTRGQWHELMGTEPWSNAECGEHCPVDQVNWYEALVYANARSEDEGLPSCYELIDCSGEVGLGCFDYSREMDGHGCDGRFTCEHVRFRGLSCAGYRLPTDAEWEQVARSGWEDSLADARSPSPAELRANAVVLETAEVEYDSDWSCLELGAATKEGACGPAPVLETPANELGVHGMWGNASEWVWGCYRPGFGGQLRDPTFECQNFSNASVRGGAWAHPASPFSLYDPSGMASTTRFADVGIRLVRTADL